MFRLISFKSLLNRRFSTSLNIISIALSVALFLGVEKIRVGAKDGFTNTISQADLIIGARSGSLQLLLYSVFHMGDPTNNIRYSTYQKFSEHPAVQWTIPISLGDSYKGFRVVGTNEQFFSHYRYASDQQISLSDGKIFEGIFDVVIGSDIAKKLKHKVGDSIILTHGLSEKSMYHHETSPFKVTGILAPTSTPIDKSVYITLYGMEAMHIGWETGVPQFDEKFDITKITKDEIELKQITTFILRSKNRIALLGLQRMIQTNEIEPLTAIIPAMALGELWKLLAYVENILFIISGCVLVIGLFGIAIGLYTSLNERRREMAILRSLGTSPLKIVQLLLFEAFILVFSGCIFGVALLYLGLVCISPILQQYFGLYLTIQPLSQVEWIYLVLIIMSGFVVGLIPALKAYKNSLQDGLTIHI